MDSARQIIGACVVERVEVVEIGRSIARGKICRRGLDCVVNAAVVGLPVDKAVGVELGS